MKNWAGNVDLTCGEIKFPSSEKEIQTIVHASSKSGSKIRVIGSGHSFTHLCKTRDVLISLDNYQGLISIDQGKLQATVKAGTKLKLLGELLFEHGMAMENMGDIDAQSIAGTICTGTHGTGVSFGTISTQIKRIKFINGQGDIVECSTHDGNDLFKAAQISLGALGIITEITLQCVPAYMLMIENRKENIYDVLSTIEERKSNNRNFEYYWFPHTDYAWTKSTNVVGEGVPAKVNIISHLSELFIENYSFKALCELARIFPSKNRFIANISGKSIPTVNKLSHSHHVYATLRLVKFTEMEYNVPADAYDEVMKELMDKIKREKYPVHFPIEHRWVKKDDIIMSPAYKRDSAYIACHVYNKKDNTKYFKDLEAIFKSYGGRPHWGKMNSFTTSDVERSYPKFSSFKKIQKEQDPKRIFVSAYMENLLGL